MIRTLVCLMVLIGLLAEAEISEAKQPYTEKQLNQAAIQSGLSMSKTALGPINDMIIKDIGLSGIKDVLDKKDKLMQVLSILYGLNQGGGAAQKSKIALAKVLLDEVKGKAVTFLVPNTILFSLFEESIAIAKKSQEMVESTALGVKQEMVQGYFQQEMNSTLKAIPETKEFRYKFSKKHALRYVVNGSGAVWDVLTAQYGMTCKIPTGRVGDVELACMDGSVRQLIKDVNILRTAERNKHKMIVLGKQIKAEMQRWKGIDKSQIMIYVTMAFNARKKVAEYKNLSSWASDRITVIQDAAKNNNWGYAGSHCRDVHGKLRLAMTNIRIAGAEDALLQDIRAVDDQVYALCQRVWKARDQWEEKQQKNAIISASTQKQSAERSSNYSVDYLTYLTSITPPDAEEWIGKLDVAVADMPVGQTFYSNSVYNQVLSDFNKAMESFGKSLHQAYNDVSERKKSDSKEVDDAVINAINNNSSQVDQIRKRQEVINRAAELFYAKYSQLKYLSTQATKLFNKRTSAWKSTALAAKKIYRDLFSQVDSLTVFHRDAALAFYNLTSGMYLWMSGQELAKIKSEVASKIDGVDGNLHTLTGIYRNAASGQIASMAGVTNQQIEDEVNNVSVIKDSLRLFKLRKETLDKEFFQKLDTGIKMLEETPWYGDESKVMIQLRARIQKRFSIDREDMSIISFEKYFNDYENRVTSLQSVRNDAILAYSYYGKAADKVKEMVASYSGVNAYIDSALQMILSGNSAGTVIEGNTYLGGISYNGNDIPLLIRSVLDSFRDELIRRKGLMNKPPKVVVEFFDSKLAALDKISPFAANAIIGSSLSIKYENKKLISTGTNLDRFHLILVQPRHFEYAEEMMHTLVKERATFDVSTGVVQEELDRIKYAVENSLASRIDKVKKNHVVYAAYKKMVGTYEELYNGYASTYIEKYRPLREQYLKKERERNEKFYTELRIQQQAQALSEAKIHLDDMLDRAEDAASEGRYALLESLQTKMEYFISNKGWNSTDAEVRSYIDEMERLKKQLKGRAENRREAVQAQEDLIRQMYNDFSRAYQDMDVTSLTRFLDDDWQAGDGTTIDDMEEVLFNSFDVFDEVSMSISGLSIQQTGEQGMFQVTYMTNMVGIIQDNDIKHVEKSRMQDIVTIQNGRAIIKRTSGGNFLIR